MRINKAPGASGITINIIWNWYKKAKEGKQQCQHALQIWQKIIKLIQITFFEGDIPVSFG
jgi:hypothetical protein